SATTSTAPCTATENPPLRNRGDLSRAAGLNSTGSCIALYPCGPVACEARPFGLSFPQGIRCGLALRHTSSLPVHPVRRIGRCQEPASIPPLCSQPRHPSCPVILSEAKNPRICP